MDGGKLTERLKSRAYFLFAGLNLLWIPIVFLFYPETAHRSLESIDTLFIPDSPFYTSQEKSYQQHATVLIEREGKGSQSAVEDTKSHG